MFRRWVAKPHRLSFDLTRAPDAVIIVTLISTLMTLTILTEAFYVAEVEAKGIDGGAHAEAIVGKAVGQAFHNAGMGVGVADFAQGFAWWLHLLIILGFSIYIPFSKHMHMVAAPLNALFNSLKPRGILEAIDLENAERFGAGRVQDFTWKQLLDGYGLRRLRPLHQQLPRPPDRQDPIPNAHCRRHQGLPDRGGSGHQSRE